MHKANPHRLNARFLVGCMVFSLIATAAFAADGDALSEWGEPIDASRIQGPVTRFNIELPGAKNNVKVALLDDGSVVYIVKRLGAGRDRMLSPDEFTHLLYRQRTSGGWTNTLFNISSPAGLAWIAVGLGGQILFAGRMLVQWLASEKNRRSVIPVSFWWMSLTGATMLLAYFIWRRDIVGVLGQATGWLIYIRNLVLIHKAKIEA